MVTKHWSVAMASTTQVFFAGVATSVLLIGAGFVGGATLVKSALDVPQKPAEIRVTSSEAPPPPEKVVLPAGREVESNRPTAPTVTTAPQPQPGSTPFAEPQTTPSQDVGVQKQDLERQDHAQGRTAEREQADKAEKRKAAQRERRHKRYAEKRARQEAARQQQQKQLQPQPDEEEVREPRGQFGIVAFEGGGAPAAQSFFGDGD